MSEINVQINNGPSAALAAPVTVAEALKKLDRDAAKQALAARVNGREVDLAFTLQAQENGDAVKIEPVLPETLAGLDVLRHSTAHLLAAAVLDLFPGTKLGIGPALLDDPRYGFFYDVIAPRPLTEGDLPVIEKKMRDIAKRNMPYRRDEISKEEALRIFAERDEPLKCELIDEKAGETVSVYYIDGSPFIDSVLDRTCQTRIVCARLRCCRWRALIGKATPNGRRCSASTARLSSPRKNWMGG